MHIYIYIYIYIFDIMLSSSRCFLCIRGRDIMIEVDVVGLKATLNYVTLLVKSISDSPLRFQDCHFTVTFKKFNDLFE